jgi:arylsulfatase A-like enzyme
VTSSYHRTTYPDWVQRFNDEILPRFQEEVEWTSTVPEAARRLARRDLARYEGDGAHTTFPHRFESDAAEDDRARERYPWQADPSAFYPWFFNSPFADEALFALAEEAVLALQLGQDSATDLLAIAIKSMDRIGHDYGPRSQEQLDIFVRLDRLLAGLLDFLDETVGEDHYIVAVSADHGAPNVVEYELEEGRPGVRITEQQIRELLDHVDRLVTAYDGPAQRLASRIARELEQFDIVARAMTPGELAGTEPADEILRYYRNSYVPGRSTPFPLWTREVLVGEVANTHPANFGIVVEYVEQGQLWTARSAHGTSYLYDREVPILGNGENDRCRPDLGALGRHPLCGDGGRSGAAGQ